MITDRRTRTPSNFRSLSYVAAGFFAIGIWVVVRLFMLQVVEHDYYQLFAQNNYDIYKKVHPARGSVFFQDVRSHAEYPAAVNRTFYTVFAVPKEIPQSDIQKTGETIAGLLQLSPEAKANAFARLGRSNSAYEPIARKVSESDMQKIDAAHLAGVYGSSESYRYYPEETSGSHVLGFARIGDNRLLTGQYGIEGYWNEVLSGKNGYLAGLQGASGNWITTADRRVLPAVNGSDLLLTIDRTLEFKLCERLQQGLEEYQAKSASLVLLNPQTGAVLALCSLPTFDPNNYSQVADVSTFNNRAIFTAYEPGSVFKPIAMAGALNENVVTPETSYVDPCERKFDGYPVPIKNAEGRCWGARTMTEVLQKSINTGMIFVEEKLGIDKFKEYIKKFGFGVRTGIELNTEVAGDISSLDKKSAIYGATASFGQGITATPIQIAAAYGAIANGGTLMRPYVVEEKRRPDGTTEKTKPTPVEQVLSPRTAQLLTGMLVAVVDNYGKRTHVDGYYVAGKTGTAQIAGKGGYAADLTNQTFAGFAPADKPQFVLVVKFEQPNTPWAELSAGPVFSDAMKFALEYFGIPKNR